MQDQSQPGNPLSTFSFHIRFHISLALLVPHLVPHGDSAAVLNRAAGV
jgi:hypothetical protein